MTTVAPPEQAQPGTTGSMPGWHIVADLTPPELIASRRLGVVRFVVLLVVLVVAACCVGGYLYAKGQAGLAAQDLATEQATTQSLLNSQRSYSGVTALQNAISDIRNDTATLMAQDVDIAALLGRVGDALPRGMAITKVDLTINAATGSSGASASNGTSGPGSLDASGSGHIGTVTLTGTGTRLADLPAFIDRLSGIDGVFAPYPLTNQTTDDGTNFSLQLTLTDALLSHKFDVTGGK